MHKKTKLVRNLTCFATIFILLVALDSCSKLDDKTQLNIAIAPKVSNFAIPIITSLDTGTTFVEIPINLDLDDMIKDHNQRFSSANIKSIRLTSAILKITDKDTAVNFSNFENIRMTIQSGTSTSNLLATLNPQNLSTQNLTIPVTSTVNDLKSLVTKGGASYLFKGKLRRPTAKIINGEAAMIFRVELEL